MCYRGDGKKRLNKESWNVKFDIYLLFYFLVQLEAFTDVYHVKFIKVQTARLAKRYLDAQEFYGGILHISYAPEYEAIDELRQKVSQRKVEIKYRQKVNEKVVLTISTDSQCNEPPDKGRKEA